MCRDSVRRWPEPHGFSVITLRNNSVIRHFVGDPVLAKVLKKPNAA
jgi:hypothetical protein